MSLSPLRNLCSLTVTVDCSRQTRLLRLRRGETEVSEDGTASGRRNGQTLRFQALWSPAIGAVQKAAGGDLDFGDLSPLFCLGGDGQPTYLPRPTNEYSMEFTLPYPR